MKLCGFEVGLDKPFFLISGPCVVESEQLQMDVAGRLKEITSALGIPFIFKSSYDKANRSSGSSFRGPGMERGLEILAKVKRELKVPVLTDVHSEAEIAAVAKVVDVLQTPAFLCRQTDFIRAVAQSGKPVNIKKGQFLAPHDMKNVIDKARAADKILRQRLVDLGLTFEQVLTEYVGVDATHGRLAGPADPEAPEVQLRIGVRSPDKAAVERFTREIAPLVLTGPPSVTGFAGGRPQGEEVVAYWPALIDRTAVEPGVRVEILEA